MGISPQLAAYCRTKYDIINCVKQFIIEITERFRNHTRVRAMLMGNSQFIHLSHNVSNLVYYIVCPAKYRRIVFDDSVEGHLKQICLGIELRYDYIHFLEIGADKDHVYFLVQSTPEYAPSKLVKIIKSITARQIFAECPQVKKQLWGGQFWSDGYFIASVGKNQNEKVIREYVKEQGKQDTEYKQLYLSI